MSTWIMHYGKLGKHVRQVWYKCDNCIDCQDPIDPECTYPPSDCTRHEATPDICYACDHKPCRCNEIRDNHKYPKDQNNA